jgi:Protein of unknown function (DUF616)
MKITVFTTVLGDTDALRPATVINRRVRYVVFADRVLHVPPYECVWLEPSPLGPCLRSRQLKILMDHPALEAPDVVLWHDAAFRLRCDPLAVAAETLTGEDLVAFRHPHRTQIEDEARAIGQLGLMAPATLAAQIASYRAEGFTQQAITSTGFSLRRVTATITAFNRAWWDEVARWGYRDQMSVDYCLWRAGLRVRYLPGHYRDNPHATWQPPPPTRYARFCHYPDLRSARGPGAVRAVDAPADAAAGSVDRRRWRPAAGRPDLRPGASPRGEPTRGGQLRAQPAAGDPGGVR